MLTYLSSSLAFLDSSKLESREIRRGWICRFLGAPIFKQLLSGTVIRNAIRANRFARIIRN